MRTYSPKASEISRTWYVLDAEGLVLGRMATEVARQAGAALALEIDSADSAALASRLRLATDSGPAVLMLPDPALERPARGQGVGDDADRQAGRSYEGEVARARLGDALVEDLGGLLERPGHRFRGVGQGLAQHCSEICPGISGAVDPISRSW